MIPILVVSGKGGVGKSTVAVNTALAIASRGVKASILDADLMGPTIHLFFNINKERLREAGRRLMPLRVNADGLEVEYMGLGAFIPRGVGIALNYEKTMDFIITLLRFVGWSGSYLVVDCPPSSIDINTRLFRELEGVARAVVVGEPHVMSFEDNLRIMDLLKLYRIDARVLVLNKYNMFRNYSEAERQYLGLGLRIVKIPWDMDLQNTYKPSLFKEVVEAIL
jgi:ATP-binding protein involved in chromosome partitioning